MAEIPLNRHKSSKNQTKPSNGKVKKNKLATNLHQGNLTAKQWWKVTKQFLRQNSDTNISLLIENDKQYCDPKDKANLLNNYFCEQSNVDDSHASLPPFDPSPFSINSIQISETDVEDVLKLLDNNKACGSDLINPRLLKEGAQILSTHLCNIFNHSLVNSYFPPSWKLANVVPIFKKGDKTNSANYRPISLLSCIGKVFELPYNGYFLRLFNFCGILRIYRNRRN